ncbi:MAG TPA: succinylglutamate desuccinylase/aspartoacylase family protein [Gaiellaceae bacterium]
MIERRVITYPHAPLAGLEHPAFEAKGAKDGPHLALIGGIHGCEYSSIAAVTRVMTELDPNELAGTITAVPVVSMQSFQRRSPFVVPEDGKNLNRSFPGSYDGTYTDVLARSIFDTLIAPADVVLDLHGGDMVEALEPFAIYEESEVEERARGMAVAMGLPYVVRERRREDGLAGMTSSAAAAAGIPAVIAEAGGCGQLEDGAVRMLAAGVRNVLRYLEMLPGEPAPPHPQLRSVGSFVWLYAKTGGWWDAAAPAGIEVREGDVLGRVRNLWGDELEEVRAPAAGVVLFVTSSPAVAEGGILLGLGAELGTDV